MGIKEQILQLKSEKDAVIIAHFYQPLEIQQVADYIGDSLGLAKIAKENISNKHIIFAGVRFMGETAVILNPKKKVFLPDTEASCPLADYLSGETIQSFKDQYPQSPVIVYVNTTADAKTHADLCCTSSNALKMVQRAAKEFSTDTFLFGPDKNLAEYVRRRTNYNIITIPGDGCCPHHDVLSLQQLNQVQADHPQAAVLIHPECRPEVQERADFIGSTGGMITYVKNHPEIHEFIIGTEVGLVEHLRWKNPNHEYYPADPNMYCADMKKNSMDKILQTLQAIGNPTAEKKYQIVLSKDVIEQAVTAINRMIDWS